jgi:hypothetical protein
MNFDKFFEEVESSVSDITLEQNRTECDHFLNNEALFQLPLISLIILIMAKDRRKPLVAEIGQLVGESIESSLVGFKGSAQHIGWSANLRVRTVKAISFLELAELIVIENRKGNLKITELGKKVINKAMLNNNNLAYNLAHLAQSYRNICVSKKLGMEL